MIKGHEGCSCCRSPAVADWLLLQNRRRLAVKYDSSPMGRPCRNHILESLIGLAKATDSSTAISRCVRIGRVNQLSICSSCRPNKWTITNRAFKSVLNGFESRLSSNWLFTPANYHISITDTEPGHCVIPANMRMSSQSRRIKLLYSLDRDGRRNSNNRPRPRVVKQRRYRLQRHTITHAETSIYNW